MFLKSPLKKERGRERGGDYISQSKTKMYISFPNWSWTMLSVMRGRFPLTHENSKYGTPTTLISSNRILLPPVAPPEVQAARENSDSPQLRHLYFCSSSVSNQTQGSLFASKKNSSCSDLGVGVARCLHCLSVSNKSREVFVSSDTEGWTLKMWV